MTKQVKDLDVGETFLDSLGSKLKVDGKGPLRQLVGREVLRVYIITERGNRMFQDFTATREVEVVK